VRPARAAAYLLAVLLVASGCSGMPTGGPVVETSAGGSTDAEDSVDINPRGPRDGDTAEEIVQGFLDAMQATPPITTSIAREFLTPEASESWKPSETIVYSVASPPRGNQEVDVSLNDASRTDSRGAWVGPLSPEDSELAFKMLYTDGKWRISELPNALIVPLSWFEPRFRQVSLYFFDPSGAILIPDPVFVPRGRQLATSLVNGLLTGPSPELADHELTFVPPGLRAVVSVPVSEAGVAQVDLTSDSADAVSPQPSQAERLVSQLAWTLRQDPSIDRFRVTIGGRTVQLPNNESEFSVEHGHDFAPYVSGASTLLYGLRDGVMVGGAPDDLSPVTGPFGSPGYALRAVAAAPRADRVAAVGEDGSTLLVGPVKASADEPVQTLLTGGQDLLDPSWDFSGRVWSIDRRREGAVVRYSRRGTMRELVVPGVTGTVVKDFLISRDGSRLVAVVRDDADEDRIVVSRILTNGQADVVRALPAVAITEPVGSGVIRDVAWATPTSIAVLHPVTRQLFKVRTVAVDGAPGAIDAEETTIGRDVLRLAGTPLPESAVYAVSDGALVDLSRARDNLVTIPDGVTSLDYAG
jgi:hypothetical protein